MKMRILKVTYIFLLIAILDVTITSAERPEFHSIDHSIMKRSIQKSTPLVGYAMKEISFDRFHRGFKSCVAGKIAEVKGLLTKNKMLNEKISVNWKNDAAETNYTKETLRVLNVALTQMTDIENYAPYPHQVPKMESFDLGDIMAAEKILYSKAREIDNMENMVSEEIKTLLVTDPCDQTMETITSVIKGLTESNSKLEKLNSEVISHGELVAKRYNSMYAVLFGKGLSKRIKFLYNEVETSNAPNDTKADIMIPLNDALLSASLHGMGERLKTLKELTLNIFPNLLKFFYCKEDKSLFLKSLVKDCSDGKNNFDLIYKNDYTRRMKHCKVKQDKKSIKIFVDQMLSQQGKDIHCARNNKLSKSIACMYKRRGRTSLEIEHKTKLLLADINYFIKDCNPVDAPVYAETVICIEKSKNRDFSSIKTSFKHWITSQVSAIYKNCKLDQTQIKQICHSKHVGKKSFYDVYKHFSLYEENYIKSVFKLCEKPIDITPVDRGSICSYFFSGKSFNSSIYDVFKNRYGLEKVKAVTKDCKRPILTPIRASKICFLKYFGKTPNHKDYSNLITVYGKMQVFVAYSKCDGGDVTYTDVKKICALDKNDANYTQKINFYKIRYDAAKVAQVKASCVRAPKPKVELTFQQKMSICELKYAGNSLDSVGFNYFKSIAGYDAVKKVYESFCTPLKR